MKFDLDIPLDFDPEIPVDSAWTPPARWYRDPAFFEQEKAIFHSTWQAVARLDQLSEPGSFVASEVAGEPVVVTRDAEGNLHALSNVCRHHAACVAEGQGQAQELTCPYHGWRYQLDGRLKSAPRLGPAKDFERSAFSLPRFQVETWGPLVFVHLGRPERSLADELRPLKLRRLDELFFVARRSWEIGCNWKVYVDNYLDGGYHVSHLHHDLAAKLDLEGYKTELFDTLSVQSCAGGEDARVGAEAVYAFLFPNFMLNRYGPWLDTNLVVPLGVDRCLTVFDYYLEPEAVDKTFIEESLKASDQVQQEDILICQSVQRGLGSRHYDKGRYAPLIEHADHQFHRLLARCLG
ncbi:MAG: diguanylate cyclase [Candidatus Xenobia bacterium]